MRRTVEMWVVVAIVVVALVLIIGVYFIGIEQGDDNGVAAVVTAEPQEKVSVEGNQNLVIYDSENVSVGGKPVEAEPVAEPVPVLEEPVKGPEAEIAPEPAAEPKSVLKPMKETVVVPEQTSHFTGEVYHGMDFQVRAFSLDEPYFDEAMIRHDWKSRGPGDLRNHFSVRWTGTIWVRGGQYEFEIRADDGVRLYVDDELLIDEWKPGSYRVTKNNTFLTHGVHNVVVEYFERQGDAAIMVDWYQIGS